jgi:hypothetical protein
MTTLNSLRNANLLMVDLSRAASAALEASKASGKPVVLTLKGEPKASGAAAWAGAPSQRSAIAFESIFSVNHVDATEMKVNLMERLGKAVGLELDDFADAAAMAKMIDGMVSEMDEGQIAALEKELGLGDLGMSLHRVLDAMKEPGGSADQQLDAALRTEAGDIVDRRDQAATSIVRFDEIGRYVV